MQRDLLEHCFANTEWQKLLQQPPAFLPAAPPPTTLNGFDSLLRAGYGVYELYKPARLTDPHEVKWHYYSLYTSPEAILADLAKHHHVFGLSATGHLPRVLANFDTAWISQQEGVQVHEITTEDRDAIAALTAVKAAIRGTDL